VDVILRLVLVHRDLLEHDLALGVDIGPRRRKDHVAHHVDRGLEMVVGHAREDDGVLPRRRRVQLAAQPIEDLGDLLRRVALRAFEQEMLDEVGNACTLATLVTRACIDPVAERNRADVRQPLADDPLARVQLGKDVLLHARMVLAHLTVPADGRPPADC
jgi:hypothetical protein